MRAARVDATQAGIVVALRKVGAFVQLLSQIGRGCPDLLAAYRGVWYVIECKVGTRWLTQQQRLWRIQAEATGAQVIVARTAEEALGGIGAIK